MSNKLVLISENHANLPKNTENYIFKTHVGYHAGLDIAVDKGCSQLFYTYKVVYYRKDLNDTYKRSSTEKVADDKGNIILVKHNKGEKKYKICKRYVPITTSIMSALKNIADEYPEYKQASTGINHDSRNMFVIDFDNENWVHYMDNWWNILPEPTYMLCNPVSGHAQIGYVLNDNDKFYTFDWTTNDSNDKKEYSEYGKKLNAIFSKLSPTKDKTADNCFTSFQCKNPYYKGFDKIIWNENKTFNRKNLESIIDSAIKTLDIKLDDKIIHKSFSAKKVKQTKSILDCQNSRNNYEIKAFREAIWKYMRENNGEKPNSDFLWNSIKNIAVEASRVTGKPQHDDTELKRIEKCTGDWAIKMFKKSQIGYGCKERNLSNRIRSAKAFINIIKVKTADKNISLRKLAKEIKCSQASIARYKKVSDDDMILYFYKINNLLHYFSTFEMNDKYKKLYDDILFYKNLYINFMKNLNSNSNIYTYNNTNVTLYDYDFCIDTGNTVKGIFSAKKPLKIKKKPKNI